MAPACHAAKAKGVPFKKGKVVGKRGYPHATCASAVATSLDGIPYSGLPHCHACSAKKKTWRSLIRHYAQCHGMAWAKLTKTFLGRHLHHEEKGPFHMSTEEKDHVGVGSTIWTFKCLKCNQELKKGSALYHMKAQHGVDKEVAKSWIVVRDGIKVDRHRYGLLELGHALAGGDPQPEQPAAGGIPNSEADVFGGLGGDGGIPTSDADACGGLEGDGVVPNAEADACGELESIGLVHHSEAHAYGDGGPGDGNAGCDGLHGADDGYDTGGEGGVSGGNQTLVDAKHLLCSFADEVRSGGMSVDEALWYCKEVLLTVEPGGGVDGGALQQLATSRLTQRPVHNRVVPSRPVPIAWHQSLAHPMEDCDGIRHTDPACGHASGACNGGIPRAVPSPVCHMDEQVHEAGDAECAEHVAPTSPVEDWRGTMHNGLACWHASGACTGGVPMVVPSAAGHIDEQAHEEDEGAGASAQHHEGVQACTLVQDLPDFAMELHRLCDVQVSV